MTKHLTFILLALVLISCSSEDDYVPPQESFKEPIPGIDIIQLPVVIHVIHNGEAEGAGPNLSTDRILRQIEILNEDFRKKEGTRGYNDHPNGADTKIEFVLAKLNPDALPIDGINRINASAWKRKTLVTIKIIMHSMLIGIQLNTSIYGQLHCQ